MRLHGAFLDKAAGSRHKSNVLNQAGKCVVRRTGLQARVQPGQLPAAERLQVPPAAARQQDKAATVPLSLTLTERCTATSRGPATCPEELEWVADGACLHSP